MSGGGILPGKVGEERAAEIGNVFSAGELAVDVDVIHDDEFGELVAHAIDLLLEVLRVGFGPPILQVAGGVELAAFIVKAVGEFVSDGGASVAVVGRGVELRIIERRLQDSGREVDVVHLRIVVGVDGDGRHHPLVPVDGLTDLLDVARGLKLGKAQNVASEVTTLNLHAGVVAPLIRVSDLVVDAVQFDERLLFGGGAHPVKVVDLALHGLLNQLGHVDGVGLGLRSEGAADELLSESFTEVVVGVLDAALPARSELLGAAQVAAVEGKILIDEGAGEILRASADEVPAQVGAPGGDRLLFDERLHALEELGLVHVDRGEGREVVGGEVLIPVEARGEGLQLGDGHLMVELVGIALFHAREGDLGELGLKAKNGCGVGRRLRGLLAKEDKHVGDVFGVVLTGVNALGVGLEVVVAVGQAEAAGIHVGDDRGGIAEVLSAAGGEERTAVVPGLQVAGGEVWGQVGGLLDPGYGLELRFERGGAESFNARLIHATGEEVSELLLHGSTGGLSLCEIVEDAPEELIVVIGQLAVDAPTGLIGGDGIVLHPAAATELVEVHAGVGRAVEGWQVEAGRVGQGRERGFFHLRWRGLGGRGGWRGLGKGEYGGKGDGEDERGCGAKLLLHC